MWENKNYSDVNKALIFATDSGNKIMALKTAVLLITFLFKAQPPNVSEWI